MKLLVLLSLLAIASSAPPRKVVINYPSSGNAQLIKYDNDNPGLGNYKFAFEQSDGIRREEQGELKNEGQKDEYIVMRGSYSWVAPDGVTYTVTYIADTNGFKPIIEQGPGGKIPEEVAVSFLG